MASFKLLARSVNQADPQIHITDVEFTFDDGRKRTVSISHFRPASLQEVRTNIENRGRSDWDKLLAIDAAELAGAALDPFINTVFPFTI